MLISNTRIKNIIGFPYYEYSNTYGYPYLYYTTGSTTVHRVVVVCLSIVFRANIKVGSLRNAIKNVLGECQLLLEPGGGVNFLNQP